MNNVDIVKRVIPFVKPYWKRYLGAGVMTVFSASIDLAAPLMLLILIDKVIPHRDPLLLAEFGAGFILLYILRSAIDYLRGRSLVIFREDVVRDMQKGLYANIQRLPLSVFDANKTGYMASRVLADTTAMSTLVGETAIVALVNLLVVAGTITIVFIMNWRLTLVAIAVAPVFGLGVHWFNRYIKDVANDVQEERSRVYGDIQESFAGIRLIKLFGLEKFRSQTVEGSIEKNRGLNIKLGILSTLSISVALLCTTIAGVSILWYGSSQVMRGLLTLGQLMAFSAYTVNIFGPIRNLVGINLGVQTSLAAGERVFDLMETGKSEHPTNQGIDISLQGGVEFKHVSFGYKPGANVLHDISFKVEPGEVVALVGESGAGKSTLLSLLSRSYESYEGEIRIDGLNAKQMRIESLLAQFGMVQQDTFLFTASVYENIRYGKLSATREEIVRAAKAANADQFICALPEGYDTEVGERGNKLSGGEKQRIAIARAVLRNPRILILDEATSSVDSRAENLIRDALASLMKGRTTFIIAHRFSTVLSADKILVLERGRIVAIGNHEELFCTSPVYKRLYEEQLSSLRSEKTVEIPTDVVPGNPRITVNRGTRGERVVTVQF